MHSIEKYYRYRFVDVVLLFVCDLMIPMYTTSTQGTSDGVQNVNGTVIGRFSYSEQHRSSQWTEYGQKKNL